MRIKHHEDNKKWKTRTQTVRALQSVPELAYLRGRFFGLLKEFTEVEHGWSSTQIEVFTLRGNGLGSVMLDADVMFSTAQARWQAVPNEGRFKIMRQDMLEQNVALTAWSGWLDTWKPEVIAEMIWRQYPPSCAICNTPVEPRHFIRHWSSGPDVRFDGPKVGSRVCCDDCSSAGHKFLARHAYLGLTGDEPIIDQVLLASHLAAARVKRGSQTATRALDKIMMEVDA